MARWHDIAETCNGLKPLSDDVLTVKKDKLFYSNLRFFERKKSCDVKVTGDSEHLRGVLYISCNRISDDLLSLSLYFCVWDGRRGVLEEQKYIAINTYPRYLERNLWVANPCLRHLKLDPSLFCINIRLPKIAPSFVLQHFLKWNTSKLSIKFNR